MIKWVAAVIIAGVAILSLWLSNREVELPPLRPLQQPTHSYAPMPGPTKATTKPMTPNYIDDSTTDVFIVGGN